MIWHSAFSKVFWLDPPGSARLRLGKQTIPAWAYKTKKIFVLAGCVYMEKLKPLSIFLPHLVAIVRRAVVKWSGELGKPRAWSARIRFWKWRPKNWWSPVPSIFCSDRNHASDFPSLKDEEELFRSSPLVCFVDAVGIGVCCRRDRLCEDTDRSEQIRTDG